MRDRRFDHLYELRPQPVKGYLLARFAEELADELADWPPPFEAWVSTELRARWADGALERPRGEVLRFALELARLELERAFGEIERRLEDAATHLATPAERSAVHLVARLLTEACLDLQERAAGARLRRPDLVSILGLVERRLLGAPNG